MAENDKEVLEIASFISENPLFESLSRPVIKSIASKIRSCRFEPSAIIMREGEIGDSFYIIREGHVHAVHVRNGQDLILSEMGLGEGFGEMALLTDQPRSCTIRAIDAVHVYVLNREDFSKLYFQFPELALKFDELKRQRVSLLESEGVSESAVAKFALTDKQHGELDYSMLDLLMKLNTAAGGAEQLEHCKETGQLAREMSKILCPMVSEKLLFAGYLHEIGKVSIPRELVERERRGEPLTPEEAEKFAHVSSMSIDILEPDKVLHTELDFIRDLDEHDYHDMRLEAQILKVANDFCELRSVFYRGMSDDDAMEQMRKGSGTLYNPRVITSLCKNIEKYKGVRVEAQLNVVRMIVLALDRKDNYTYRHSVDVRNISLVLADRLKLNKRDRRYVEIGSELHDAGKIFIDERILNAPRRLTDEEFKIMQTHAAHSAEFFTDIYGMQDLAKIISAHHEKYNGTGYPNHLKGDEIPFIARIMTVADIWSALTTPRVYRLGPDGKPKGMPPEKAFSIMEEMNEKGDFDPQIYGEFKDYVQETFLDNPQNITSRDLPT